MSVKDTLKKAAGLFFEFDEPPPSQEWNVMTATKPGPALSPAPTTPSPRAKTAEQIVREQPGPNLDEIKVPTESASQTPTVTAPAEPVIRDDGSINYDSIYKLAQLPPVPFTAEQILDLFAGLPQDLPLESKRSTVKVTLGAMAKSMGVSTEQIVADASRKLAALAAYSESYAKQAAEYVTKCEADIASMQQQIEMRKQGIEVAKAKQASMHEACSAEGKRLDEVLEFFSLDVPPSSMAKH